MSIGAFLPGLELEQYWELKSSSRCLLLVCFNPLVDIAHFRLRVDEVNRGRHLELGPDITWQLLCELLHAGIECEPVADLVQFAHIVDHFDIVFFAEGL